MISPSWQIRQNSRALCTLGGLQIRGEVQLRLVLLPLALLCTALVGHDDALWCGVVLVLS